MSKENSRAFVSVCVIGVMIFAAFVVALVLYITESRQHATCRNQVVILQEEIENSQQSKVELQSLRNRLSGIKDQDDLLKRDIQLYIDTKYPMTPKVVSTEIAERTVEISNSENVSSELVVGIMQVETNFNPRSISKKNARGLMQVMPEWVPKLNLSEVCDLHDIGTNIQSGIRVLKIHIEENDGNLQKGLYHYVNKDGTYSDKVYNAMGRFVAFRSTVDDMTKSDETEAELNKTNGTEEDITKDDTTDEAPEPSIDEPSEQVEGGEI